MSKPTFNIFKPSLIRSEWDRRRLIQVVSLLLILSELTVNAIGANAQPIQKGVDKPTNMRSQSAVAVSIPKYPLKEGIHLFGQARTPDQVQTEYLVFKITRNRVIGAFFMPSSSFDCFSGTKEASKLNLKVIESYEQQTYDHSVNLNQYHPIKQISNNDLRILDMCAGHSNHTAKER